MTSELRALKPLRVLVIGAGPAADAIHLPVLARLRDRGEIELALVCDLQRDRAAAARRKFGFLEDSGDAIVALERADFEAAYIFGSAQMHYEYGVHALRHGKHLFVEKPVAPSFAQARDLAGVAKVRGLIAVGGLNRRFAKSLLAVIEQGGKAGWRFAEAVFHKPEHGHSPSFGARTWLGANGIHALDALTYVMGGLPEQLTALAGESAASEPGAFSALMRWRDGAQGVFLCNNNAGSRREEYVFHAPDETLSITAEGLKIEKKGRPPRSIPLPMQGEGYAAEHEAFLQAIRSGVEPPHSLAKLAPSLFLAELIESGYSGCVQLPRNDLGAAVRGGGAATQSILVVQPQELLMPLGSLLPQYRFASLEDLDQSVEERPDIVAAILGRGSPPLAGEVLAKLPNLRIVGIVALSLARHEPEALLTRGVTLVNASRAYAESVAEFALGLAILGRRRAFLSHEAMRLGGWGAGRYGTGLTGKLNHMARRIRPLIKSLGFEGPCLRLWNRAAPLIGTQGPTTVRSRDLQGATVGLVGWGANARAFAERLGRVPARVLVYSEHASERDIRSSGAYPASLGEVLAADIVSLHRGLTEATRYCIGAAELDRLRPGAVLINVARGALVEPSALLARLRRGDIFACLDVFEHEPPRVFDPLRRLPNVFLSAHLAGGSPDNYAAAASEVVGKVAAHLAGDASEVVGAERLRTMS